MMLLPLENETFFVQHLLDSSENIAAIQSFTVGQESGGAALTLSGLCLCGDHALGPEIGYASAETTPSLAAYFSRSSAGISKVSIACSAVMDSLRISLRRSRSWP